MSLYHDCKTAGAIEPYRVAASIRLRARRVGIQQAIADIKLAQPQWFAMVEKREPINVLRDRVLRLAEELENKLVCKTTNSPE